MLPTNALTVWYSTSYAIYAEHNDSDRTDQVMPNWMNMNTQFDAMAELYLSGEWPCEFCEVYMRQYIQTV